MRWAANLLCAIAAGIASFSAGADTPPLPAASFLALCYHEARDEVRDYPDPYAVDSAALVRQFAWLRGNGYTPVSLDDIVSARNGGKPLPAKAVLLSFDDAFLSFYTRVYPLLREFRFPALLGVVGKWIDHPQGSAVLYGENDSLSEASFPSWKQLREMADSGLVEIASHTYDLHHGVLANPQGNLQPAATARIYDTATGLYESDASWRARVRADLARNADVIARETGRRPRAIVWPYGSFNEELVSMAGSLGMPIALTLDDGFNTPAIPLSAVRRKLIKHNPTLSEFAAEARGPLHPEPVRVVQVSLDDVYSADPAQQERHLSLLLERMQALKPSHVYLQAVSGFDGNGVADLAYFPTRHLRLRADLFNRAAWQIKSRVEAKVFAVMPLAGLPAAHVADVYEDLARHANFDGLVFDDRLQANGAWGADTTELTRNLALRARAFRAPLQTVRTLNADAGTQSAQQFSAMAAAFDFIALKISPAADSNPPVEAWKSALAFTPDAEARRKAVFMLRNRPPAPPGILARQMLHLQLGGFINFGYFPDDYLHDNPPLAEVAPAMSLRVYLPAQGGRP